MQWSDDSLDDETPPMDSQPPAVPQSRTDALGRPWLLLFVVLTFIPLVPLVEWVHRSVTFAPETRPLTLALAPLGMLGTGCLLATGAWRVRRNTWQIALSFVEGFFVLPRLLLSLFNSLAVPW